MCVVSMIGDHYSDKWRGPYFPSLPVDPTTWPSTRPVMPVDRHEFEQLKRDVQEMKELLKRAKDYDERNNEPDCEIEDKMVLLRKIAEAVGVSLDDVLGRRGEAA